ncbi:MAG: NAD-dependent epimerase/dehydratase family protein [Candidatus Kapaibacterium sp.]
MKIAISGGAGFIGSHIADAYINAGHEVTIIDNMSTGRRRNINPAAELIEMDINDPALDELFFKRRFDAVNHHAAQMDIRVSVADPAFDAQNNIIGGIRLMEAARKSGVRKIVFASSGGAVYGEQEYFPADERHPTAPISPYGISKLTTEKYLYYYKEIHGMDFVAFRYTNIYGPRQNPFGEAGVVAIFANKMFAGQQPVINGDGKNSRDYVYVGDVVRANVMALDEDFSGIYNIATGREHDVNYIFRTLRNLTGAQCKEIHGEAKSGEQRRSVCSHDKITREQGWQPEVRFEEGLRDTVEFFRNLNDR